MKDSYQTIDPCIAYSKAISQEMPRATKSLSVKYPVEVGSIRILSELFIDDVDKATKELTELFFMDILSEKENPEKIITCFASLAAADIDRNKLRKEIESSIERSFNLPSREQNDSDK